MAKRKLNEELEAKILELYNENYSAYAVAERLGLGSTTVYRVLERNGIRPSGLARHYKRVRKLPELKELKRLYESGVSVADIAAAHAAHERTVYESLVRAGANMRPRGNNAKVLTAEQERLALELYEKTRNQSAVAREIGISQPVVSRLLRSLGVFDGRRASGPRHRSWKGGRVAIGPYVAVLVPHDDPMRPMAQRSGYVMEHRLVMGRYIGRPLEPQETVHHINGDTRDNRIENLQLRNGQHGHGVVHRCRDCGSHNIESAKLN